MVTRLVSSFKSWKLDFLARFGYLTSHSEFQQQPAKVTFRLLSWQVFKLIRYNPTIRIHKKSKMFLKPCKRIGIHGFVYIFKNEYEPVVNHVIDRYALPGTICYDIGANIGLWTLKMSELVGDSGRVYAFEPLSKNLELLKLNVAFSENKNIEIVSTGLGADQGTATLYIPSDPGRSALAAETSEDETETITIQRLDDIWESQGCPPVLLVKIDVEGSEPLVLKGGAKFFSQGRPVVCCEVNSHKLNAMGMNPNMIFEVFQAWNYNSLVWDLATHSLVQYKPREDEWMSEVVFIPKESIE